MAGEMVRIGILPDEIVNKNTNRLNYGQTDEYSEAIWEAGGLPSMLHSTDDPERVRKYYDDYDAFVFSGGLDLNPRFYKGAEGLPTAKLGDIRNDNMAMQLLEMALSSEEPKPLVGICRGMQILNVKLGGTLDQHLPDLGRDVDHRSTHAVNLVGGTLLAEAVGGIRRFEVNSRHHQAIAKLGRGLVVAARADDGVIEAVELADPNRFVVGVQWHDEEMPLPSVFRPLVQAAAHVKNVRGYLRQAA